MFRSSTDSLSDDATLKSDNVDPKAADARSDATSLSETVIKDSETESGEVDTESARSEATSGQSGVPAENKNKGAKDGRKEEKKEEKKKSKKKEDKSIDYILRALNSLHSPEEKLAALCKKYADLHEEHRVLQTSFKTQQRTISVVMREKDQLQSEHTKAMMAKSKLESLCRELQKHNKIIKDESIKRAKEDDEKRKEISAQFNHTIGEIQTQMSDNSERNAKLRQENENLAAQLRSFIKQCEVRDLQVEKLHEQHELEKKLAEAKMNQAQAIIKEHEEKAIKERELLLLKLAESGKKSQILEAQVNMFKERYDEFEKLHTRSSETFQKYKTEMDKMTKRIKKLEKDGLQWKTKWESSNKALIEQIEARSKSEKESLIHIQKTKKLESLCRALQAELHGKKVVDPAENKIDVQDSSSSSTVKNNDSSTVVEQSSNHESSPAASSSPPPPASPSPVASSSSSESPCMPNGTAPTPATADTTCPQPPPSEESLPQTVSVSSTSSVSTPDLSGSEPANNRVQSADEGDSLSEKDQAASLA
ncbi:hypothetical protein Btru_002720 [Bulinus truncatus]|nr:hypothetical protein Btru_002720 [Bulinus truncatus]